jgi:hypothetical protein
MKKIFVIILLLVVTATSTQAKSIKKPTRSGISYISMHRSSCFGRCPDYKIEIYSNGLARYSGYFFVIDSGVYEKNIGTATISKLFKQFDTYRVDTCQKNYDQKIADMPGLYYVITYKGKTLQINNAHFGPPFLMDLAKEIDAAIKVDKTWKKTAKVATR